jgi:hypothetical protein
MSTETLLIDAALLIWKQNVDRADNFSADCLSNNFRRRLLQARTGLSISGAI